MKVKNTATELAVQRLLKGIHYKVKFLSNYNHVIYVDQTLVFGQLVIGHWVTLI